jgi:hypothetical protein
MLDFSYGPLVQTYNEQAFLKWSQPDSMRTIPRAFLAGGCR